MDQPVVSRFVIPTRGRRWFSPSRSVLQLADRMVTSPEVDPSATFPSTEMGDQSAVITRALLEAALPGF